VLGYGDDVLGDTLAVGDRYLPFEYEADATGANAFAMTMEDLQVY
jgi:hypothetical protein